MKILTRGVRTYLLLNHPTVLQKIYEYKRRVVNTLRRWGGGKGEIY